MSESRTVLIVDDEPLIRRALVALLQRRGYRAIAAGSGEEGLRMARRHLPALILLNIQLPDKDGWRIHDELARTTSTASIPIIAITGFPAALSRLAALQNGFTSFLEKPFRYSELIRAVHDVLGPPAARAVSCDETDR